MDGETALKSVYIIAKPSSEYKKRQSCKASVSGLLVEGGVSDSIVPKLTLNRLKEWRALFVVFR